MKAKQAKEEEKKRKEEELRKRTERTKRRQPFDFEKEKPQILNTIAETSQAASNLVNALKVCGPDEGCRVRALTSLPKFVNPEHESIQSNERVLECLEKAKQARKRVVRYIQVCRSSYTLRKHCLCCKQLVENEELIGTLLETNERIIDALQQYDLVRTYKSQTSAMADQQLTTRWCCRTRRQIKWRTSTSR
jgi:anion-transporting  ArsA/GET3 family ATPase